MSKLLDFFRGNGKDSEGRLLREIWAWPIDELERCHDFIQWLFPLSEPSAFNPDAPLLTNEDRAAFRSDPQLQAALRRSLEVFLHFLGLTRTADGSITPADNFSDRVSLWKYQNHNWLRITRVLKSLRLLGLNQDAQALWKCLEQLHTQDGFVSEQSFAYWQDAAT